MRPVGVGKKRKKGQKLSCVKLAICPDHPRRRRPLKFCMRGRVRELVIYFQFHENRSRGLRAVEGRKSPSPIELIGPWLIVQLNCTTVQAVIHLPQVTIRWCGWFLFSFKCGSKLVLRRSTTMHALSVISLLKRE